MFDSLTLISLLIAIALFIGLISFYQIKEQVPEDDRQYMDPLPLLMRLSWPAIKFIAHYLGDHLSVEYVEKSKNKLQRSGLGYLLIPSQFFALQVISALVFSLISWWAMVALKSDVGLIPYIFACLGFFFPQLDLSERRKKRELQLIKMLPVYLDFITMAVQSGMNINGAIMQAVDKGPKGPLNVEFQKVLRDIKAGSGRVTALRNMSQRLEIKEIGSLVSSLAQAEKSGSSIGETLRIQSDQRRVERFQRAEKLAMQAPVKLVGPLVLFIFPTTFIILFFPIVTQLLPMINN
jgi:tight adherence protein C